MKKRRLEIWMKPTGDLVAVQWNPCGCHPEDIMIEEDKKTVYCWIYQNKSVVTKILKKRGWERIDADK